MYLTSEMFYSMHWTSPAEIMKRLLVLTMMGFLFGACSGGNYAPLTTVEQVDVSRYVGKWYEIASLPFSRQEGCSCTTAEYEVLEDGVLRVKNSCMKEGELTVANGKAFVVEGTNNTKLRVQFFWPFRCDYWVIDLAPDYSYAVVGVPSREYCWILSRKPSMDDATYAAILERIKVKGFDIARFNRTRQDCN